MEVVKLQFGADCFSHSLEHLQLDCKWNGTICLLLMRKKRLWTAVFLHLMSRIVAQRFCPICLNRLLNCQDFLYLSLVVEKNVDYHKDLIIVFFFIIIILVEMSAQGWCSIKSSTTLGLQAPIFQHLSRSSPGFETENQLLMALLQRDCYSNAQGFFFSKKSPPNPICREPRTTCHAIMMLLENFTSCQLMTWSR